MTNFTLRPAQPSDIPVLFDLIQSLAEYEKLAHAVTGNITQLEAHLFGERPYAESIIAEIILPEKPPIAVGYSLFFYNYSTFLTKPGIYLEDLFVLPEYRGKGIGKAMIKYLAKMAIDRDFGRIEWSVLDWNEKAIGFYQNMGADILPDWRICRVTGNSLTNLSL